MQSLAFAILLGVKYLIADNICCITLYQIFIFMKRIFLVLATGRSNIAVGSTSVIPMMSMKQVKVITLLLLNQAFIGQLF